MAPKVYKVIDYELYKKLYSIYKAQKEEEKCKQLMEDEPIDLRVKETGVKEQMELVVKEPINLKRCHCMIDVNEPQQTGGAPPPRATGSAPWTTWEQTIEEIMKKKKLKKK